MLKLHKRQYNFVICVCDLLCEGYSKPYRVGLGGSAGSPVLRFYPIPNWESEPRFHSFKELGTRKHRSRNRDPIPKAGSQSRLQENTRFWGPTRLQLKYPVVWAPTLEPRATGSSQYTRFSLMSYRQNVTLACNEPVKAPHTTDANRNVCA